ncbi:MAG: hypothetical protein HYY16_08565 [Planctomycetes bacterium]|nr:hypothetical protein [Planctomycetota bacterium]
MTYVFRALGWLLFGAGAIVFIGTGGFTAVRDGSVLTMAAGILMPVGMFITAMSNVIRTWKWMRARPEKPESQPSEDPPASQKQYRVRPLDPGKKPPEGD